MGRKPFHNGRRGRVGAPLCRENSETRFPTGVEKRVFASCFRVSFAGQSAGVLQNLRGLLIAAFLPVQKEPEVATLQLADRGLVCRRDLLGRAVLHKADDLRSAVGCPALGGCGKPCVGIVRKQDLIVRGRNDIAAFHVGGLRLVRFSGGALEPRRLKNRFLFFRKRHILPVKGREQAGESLRIGALF